MNTKHYPSWPDRLPKTLTVPETTVYDNLLVSAKRYPDKVAVHYYGASYTYNDLFLEVEGLAGFLEHSFMAAYKYPRLVEFRTSLPTTASGKILWRQLQEEESGSKSR